MLPFGTERVIPCAGLAPSGGHIHRQQASQVFVVETSAGAVWESPFRVWTPLFANLQGGGPGFKFEIPYSARVRFEGTSL